MSLKLMPKTALSGWVERLCENYRVVGPKAKHGQHVFDRIHKTDDLALDYPTSILPPKKYLLPTREELFPFSDNGMQFEVQIETEPTIIFGLHTCDMHAIQLLDRVHNTGYADQHYRARRKNTYLVSIECLNPCMEESFCKSMGTLNLPEEFDLHLTDLGDNYAIDIGSEKGEELLAGIEPIFDPADDDYRRLNRVMAEKWPRFPYRLDMDVTELPHLLNLSQNSSYWQDLGEKCLACGLCTIVCPTCYCFDVEDEVCRIGV